MSLEDIAPERRKQTPRVRSWHFEPGKPIPMPDVEDDREKFKPSTVKSVLAWLESKEPEFHDMPPTPIQLNLSKTARDPNMLSIDQLMNYGVGAAERMEHLYFRTSTCEVLLRQKSDRKILFGFHFLCARDQSNRVIVGPFLRAEIKQGAA